MSGISNSGKYFPMVCQPYQCTYLCHRYLAVVINGVRNPHRKAVARDISNAIYKTYSQGKHPAEYRTKEEQEVLLTELFTKWLRVGDVWTEAASKVWLSTCSISGLELS
jgi:hypothetical protein